MLRTAIGRHIEERLRAQGGGLWRRVQEDPAYVLPRRVQGDPAYI